jgi:hypothetical protein
MTNPTYPNRWTLRDERHFLDRITSQYGHDRKARLSSAAACLRGYVAGLELRWYDLNSHGLMTAGTRQVLRRYAVARIRRLAK